MGMYDKVNNSRAGVVRKLMDYHVSVRGRKVEMIRIGVDADFWGNADLNPLSENTITAIVNFPPGELPLLRLRGAQGMAEGVTRSGTFFYDILPIEAFFSFKDRIERHDVFYFTVADEAQNPMPIVLKVMDSVGGVTTQLVWRKFMCSPITGLQELPEDVQARLLERIGITKGIDPKQETGTLHE
jgi:hypothetical protein